MPLTACPTRIMFFLDGTPYRNSMADDFKRPPPAAPPPLEEWLLRSDRADRYREPFFRGRVAEYEAFRRGVRALAGGVVGGQTLVFQGAPGAGKSALMHECIAAVRIHSTLMTYMAVIESNGWRNLPISRKGGRSTSTGSSPARSESRSTTA